MSNKTQIFNKIKELINNGSSVTQAISVVCQQYNINPNIIYNEFYKSDNYEKNFYFRKSWLCTLHIKNGE